MRAAAGGNRLFPILAVLGFLHAQPAVSCSLFCLLRGHAPGIAGHAGMHPDRGCHGGTVGARESTASRDISAALTSVSRAAPMDLAIRDVLEVTPPLARSTPNQPFDPPPPRD